MEYCDGFRNDPRFAGDYVHSHCHLNFGVGAAMICVDSSKAERPIHSGDGGSIPTSTLHKLAVRPTTLRKANDFVQAYHRHNGRTARDGGKFAIACEYDGVVVGVAIVGNPLSATYMDKDKYGAVAEVLRTCTNNDAPKNAVSFLYGACTRICREMGFDLLVSYTLTDESGASLRGAGWKQVADTKPVKIGWRKKDHLSITREYQEVMGLVKHRWECRLRQHLRSQSIHKV